MRQAERLETILEWLSGNGSVNVADISDELGVSAATSLARIAASRHRSGWLAISRSISLIHGETSA